MSDLEIERRSDHIAWIRINRPPLNDLTPALIDELIAAHQSLAEDDNVWGVLLGARGDKFYCNGMAPDYMLSQDVAGRRAAFEKLFDLMRAMYAFPKPEAAVINGHAMAGGAVLGIFSDFRWMADGKFRFAFTEVAVGLTIPDFLLHVIESVVGPRHLRDIAMLATAYRPEEARAIGLVDAVFPATSLEAEAEAAMRKVLTLPQASLRSVKRNMRARLLTELENTRFERLEDLKPFLVGNFEEGMRAVLERRRPEFKNP